MVNPLVERGFAMFVFVVGCVLFSCIYGLLLSPDKSDPLDSTLALQSYNDDGGYEAACGALTEEERLLTHQVEPL